MSDGYFVSRSELLSWLNGTLGTNYAKVEECKTGVAFNALLSMVSANSGPRVPLNRVKMGAVMENDCVHNFKILQDVLTKQGIEKTIEIDKIVKGNYQLNLELLQWMKRHCETQGMVGPAPLIPNSGTSAPSTPSATPKRAAAPTTPKRVPSRSNSRLMMSSSAAATSTTTASQHRSVSEISVSNKENAPTAAAATATPAAKSTPVARGRSPMRSAPGTAPTNATHRTPAATTTATTKPEPKPSSQPTSEKTALVSMERDFFYDKLRDIEILVRDSAFVESMSSEQLAEAVRLVLYKPAPAN
eukprot:PhM_4_TR15851/c0_g1_i1/m.80960/K10436/MAPRE; microtubule-associated protein, RP/EB family